MTSQPAQVIPLEEMNRKLKMLRHLEGLGFAGALLLVIVAGSLIAVDISHISLTVPLVLCLALILYVAGPILVSSRREKLECRWHQTEGYVALRDHHPERHAVFLTLSTSYRRVIVLEDSEETLMYLKAADDYDLRVVLAQRLDPLTNRFLGKEVRTFYP